jgi:DnaJ-class molecular chaperone
VTPFICPVCGGRGIVREGFYLVMSPASGPTTSVASEPCRSCQGTGIVWSPHFTFTFAYKPNL